MLTPKEINSIKVLDEISIYANRSTKKGELQYSIHVDPDNHRIEGYLGNPYIKVCDDVSWKKATKSIRLSMKDGSVIYHNDGKGNLNMDSSLRKFLEDAMVSPSSYDPSLTVYEAFYKFLYDNFHNIKDYDKYTAGYPFKNPWPKKQ